MVVPPDNNKKKETKKTREDRKAMMRQWLYFTLGWKVFFITLWVLWSAAVTFIPEVGALVSDEMFNNVRSFLMGMACLAYISGAILFFEVAVYIYDYYLRK